MKKPSFLQKIVQSFDISEKTVEEKKEAVKPSKVQDMTAAERDAKWREYSKSCEKHLRKGEYASYRQTRLMMATFRAKEGSYESSISLLTEVLHWDINQCSNNQLSESIKNLETVSPFLFQDILIPPAVMREMAKGQKALGWTDEQMRSAMTGYAEPISLPMSLYTTEEVIDIYFLYRDGDQKALKKIVGEAKKRMKKLYPKLKL